MRGGSMRDVIEAVDRGEAGPFDEAEIDRLARLSAELDARLSNTVREFLAEHEDASFWRYYPPTVPNWVIDFYVADILLIVFRVSLQLNPQTSP